MRPKSVYDSDVLGPGHDLKQPNKTQTRMLMQAARVALRSNMTQQHGCIIVDPNASNRVVASGYNFKMSYLQHQFSIHAEVHALSKMKKMKQPSVGAFDMYVVRIARDNEHDDSVFRMSKPCCACKKAIEESSHIIRRVYYSFS